MSHQITSLVFRKFWLLGLLLAGLIIFGSMLMMSEPNVLGGRGEIGAARMPVENDALTAHRSDQRLQGDVLVKASPAGRAEAYLKQLQADALHQQHWIYVLSGIVLFLQGIAVTLLLWMKRTRHQLQQEKDATQAILTSIPVFLFEVGLDGRYFYAHSAQPNFLLESGEALLGKTVSDVMPHDAAEICMSALREAYATGMSTGKQIVLPLTQGTRWFEIFVTRKAVRQGKEPRLILLLLDMTERVKLEHVIRECDRHFRNLVGNWPDEIVRYDRHCHRVYINSHIEKAVGAFNHRLNQSPTECYPDSLDAEFFERKLKEVLETGISQRFERTWSTPAEPPSYQDVRMTAAFDDGVITGVFVIARDITEFKKNEHRLQESEHLLRQLAARIEVVREDERKSLAREVHDELGQHLLALRLSVDAIGLKFGEGNTALQKKIDRITEIVDGTIKMARNLVAALRPMVLDVGIKPALNRLVEEYKNRTNMLCELDIRGEYVLDDKVATVIFRVVQESLTNIARHANASKVWIVLERLENQYVLQVHDNGKGFDPTVSKAQSFGLQGMQERVLVLGGDIEISSVLGRGTVVKVSLPLEVQAQT